MLSLKLLSYSSIASGSIFLKKQFMVITTKWGINLKTKLKFCIYTYMKNENICFEITAKKNQKRSRGILC